MIESGKPFRVRAARAWKRNPGAPSCVRCETTTVSGLGDGDEARGQVDIGPVEITEHRNHLAGGQPDADRRRLVFAEGGHEVQSDLTPRLPGPP